MVRRAASRVEGRASPSVLVRGGITACVPWWLCLGSPRAQRTSSGPPLSLTPNRLPVGLPMLIEITSWTARAILYVEAQDCPLPSANFSLLERGGYYLQDARYSEQHCPELSRSAYPWKGESGTIPATPSAAAWAPPAAPTGGAHRRSRTCAAGSASPAWGAAAGHAENSGYTAHGSTPAVRLRRRPRPAPRGAHPAAPHDSSAGGTENTALPEPSPQATAPESVRTHGSATPDAAYPSAPGSSACAPPRVEYEPSRSDTGTYRFRTCLRSARRASPA